MEDISQMFTLDIKTEICTRQFELLDFTLDEAYRQWVNDRLTALLLEYDRRNTN